LKTQTKTTTHASHRKRHLAATAKPIVRQRLERLRDDWNDLNQVQRGDPLIQLLSAGSSERGLAHDLAVDDGTVRRAIEIARLAAPERNAIEAGASPKAFLRIARNRTQVVDARTRLKRELKDGIPSNELRDKLVWFLLTEQAHLCYGGYVEQLIREVKEELSEKEVHGIR
jgi:hypothetical protein